MPKESSVSLEPDEGVTEELHAVIPSAKALGKRRASPSPVTRASPPPTKRRRSSSAPTVATHVPVLDIEDGTIDLTEDDSELELVTVTGQPAVLSDMDTDEDSDDESMTRLFDEAKQRHAAALRQTTDIVDLTEDSPGEQISPLVGSTSKPVSNGETRILFSELACPICMTSPSPLVVTKCGHTFCGPCIHSALYNQSTGQPGMPGYTPGNIDHGRCPVCRTELIGGWGKAIRGCSFKSGPVKHPGST